MRLLVHVDPLETGEGGREHAIEVLCAQRVRDRQMDELRVGAEALAFEEAVREDDRPDDGVIDDHEEVQAAPAATPSAAIAHTSAAVVKPNTRSLLRISAPAPRKPIPVMTPPRRVKGLSASKSIARIARAAAPVDTKMNVPKPTGLRRICRSRPIPNASAKTSRSRKTLSAGSIVTREPGPDGTSHRPPHAERVYFSFFSTRGENQSKE